MMMTWMLDVDGLFLTALAGLLVAIVHRCYVHANFFVRAALYSTATVAFFSGLHVFGIVPLSLAHAYWARIVLDGLLVVAACARLIWGRFVPTSSRQGR
jgi:hypothetical protein